MIVCKKCGSNEIYHSAFVKTNGYTRTNTMRICLKMYAPNVVSDKKYWCENCCNAYTPHGMKCTNGEEIEPREDDLDNFFEV